MGTEKDSKKTVQNLTWGDKIKCITDLYKGDVEPNEICVVNLIHKKGEYGLKGKKGIWILNSKEFVIENNSQQ